MVEFVLGFFVGIIGAVVTILAGTAIRHQDGYRPIASGKKLPPPKGGSALSKTENS